MANGNPQSFRHLRVDGFGSAQRFVSRLRVPGRRVPEKNRAQHAAELREDLADLELEYQALSTEWAPWEHIREKGIVVEIEAEPGQRVDVPTLERQRYGFQLLSIRSESRAGVAPVQYSTWFVPDGKLSEFEGLLAKYEAATGERGNRKAIDVIVGLRRAAVQQLWTEREPWPEEQAPFWFECWLRAPDNVSRQRILDQFVAEAARVEIRVGETRLSLREHTIVMAFGRPEQFTLSSALLSCLAELRRGRDVASFVDSLGVVDQAAWLEDLTQRVAPPNDDLAICVLDTGVNRGHPLLSAVLRTQDALSIKPHAWGSADDYPGHGHGTPMAGICLLGDIASHLPGTVPINPPAVLEAVKVVPPAPALNTDEKAAAAYTAQGVATAELNRPDRRRIWCIATSMDGENTGTPSSWSAEIDQLAAGVDREDGKRRLIVLAAGNVVQDQWRNYPQSNFDTAPQNPAQAWNAVVVGAYTEMTGDPTLRAPTPPFVLPGSLAPCSPTSLRWLPTQWPYRPDVVFEGGNAEQPMPGSDPLVRPDLQPLSISADFVNGAFCSFGATSAATAECANFAAQIARRYVDYRPETVRALICHSAGWTDRMWSHVDPALSAKQKHQRLLRTVGFGVPSLRRALETSRSCVTLVAERELQPFARISGRITSNHMDVFTLPWAETILGSNPDEHVRLKVTLSYFVEPNPGSRGYTSIYRYAGCQLRFRVSDPGQSRDDLVNAVSAATGADETEQDAEPAEPPRFSRDARWMIGPSAATRGSLHCDFWEGPAAEVADMKHIAVYPMTGWWKTRAAQRKYDAIQPYSLIVTLESMSGALDLYTEISTAVAIEAPVEL